MVPITLFRSFHQHSFSICILTTSFTRPMCSTLTSYNEHSLSHAVASLPSLLASTITQRLIPVNLRFIIIINHSHHTASTRSAKPSVCPRSAWPSHPTATQWTASGADRARRRCTAPADGGQLRLRLRTVKGDKHFIRAKTGSLLKPSFVFMTLPGQLPLHRFQNSTYITEQALIDTCRDYFGSTFARANEHFVSAHY